MPVRHAESNDIPELINMAARFHEESAYAFLAFEREKVQQFLEQAIDSPDRYCCLVSFQHEALTGILVGVLADYFFCGEKSACDMAFFVEKPFRGTPTAHQLLSVFLEWSTVNGAREVCLSTSTNISPQRTGRFYERSGLVHVGGVYKMRIHQSLASAQE